MQLIDIKSMTAEELQSFVTDCGLPKFRAAQIGGWLQKGVTEFGQMKNISGELRQFLESRYYISVATIEKKLVSRYDKTVKYLFSLNDGECVEAVIMHYKHGVHVHFHTGRLQNGLHLLRNGQKRFFTRPCPVRDACADRSRAARLKAARS